MKYVIKLGPFYADGNYNWVTERDQAFVFRYVNLGGGIDALDAIEWAKGHLRALRNGTVKRVCGKREGRIVRLKK